jgi:diguanylate cyclase (GGDEF)-like protein
VGRPLRDIFPSPPTVVADEGVRTVALRVDGTWFTATVAASTVEHLPDAIRWTVDICETDVEDRSSIELEALSLGIAPARDPLTGLPSRAYFEDLVAPSLAVSGEVGVLFVDVDRLMHINDTHGYKAGDAVLQSVAKCILRCVSPAPVARLGGDEFVVLLPGASPAEASNVAQKILEELAAPVDLPEGAVSVRASIGIACAPSDGADASTLLRHAELALSQAKELGRGRCCHFERQSADALLERISLDRELRQALERGELSLVYQPRVALDGGGIRGVEALLRWTHPTFGEVSPAKFIPLAESTGQIEAIGNWVVRTACAQAMAWRRAGWFNGVLSVNVSALQLRPQFLDSVASALAQTGFPPACLELEITESVLATDSGARELLAEFTRWGVLIALDDFGTGYSNLAALQRWPVAVLKLDRSLMCHIDEGEGPALVVVAAIQLGHTLGMTVVAEGVETVEQRDALRRYRCDEFQGFVYAPGLPPDRVAALLQG